MCRLSFSFDFQERGTTLLNKNPAVALSGPTLAGQSPSTEPLTQVVQYIMENLPGDLSVSLLAGRFSLKESTLLPSFESHSGVALEQFVRRQRVGRALHLVKNSDARDSEIAAGIVWRTTPALNDLQEVCRRNSGRRVVRGASARPSLPAYRGKNLVDGRFRYSQCSN